MRGDFAPGRRRRRREERDQIYTSLQSQCMSLKAGLRVAIPLLSHLPRRPGKPDSDLIYLPCLSAPAFPANGEHKLTRFTPGDEMRFALAQAHALVMVQTTPLFAPVPPSLPSSDWASVRPLGPTDGCSLALCL